MAPLHGLGRAFALLLSGLALIALATTGPRASAEPLSIGFIGQAPQPGTSLSPLDVPASNAGIAGAELAIRDDNRTGQFTRQSFELQAQLVGSNVSPIEAVRKLAAQGIRLVVVHLQGDALGKVLAEAETAGLLLINSLATDDAYRNENCRSNLLHTAPSRVMLADALAQYLHVKRWSRWLLVVGPHPEDRAYAAAMRRAGQRFGGTIVAEKEWTFRIAGTRSDTGHVTLQSEIPVFTRGPEHDVVVVADERGEFGEYLLGRTDRARLVMGTQGVTPTVWSPVLEQWGSTQLKNRFRQVFGREMHAEDYTAWAAVRGFTEAAIRTRSSDPDTIGSYLRAPEFLLPAFKGQGLSFRSWDGQMRQPILIAGPRLLVSVSPQPGFLHQRSELDSLGHDREESRCKR